MSGDNTIDTISIDVVSSSDNATKDIDTLIAKLDKLQSVLDSSKAGKLVEVLNQVGSAVDDLHKKLSNLNSINFEELSNNLKSVINNANKVANEVANAEGTTKSTKRKNSEPKEEIESDDIKPAKNIFVLLGRAGMQASMLIGSGFKTAFQGAIGGTKKFGNLAVKTFGNGVKSAGKFATRLLNIGKNTAKVTGNFAKFTSKIKIMSLALLGARSAFTAIRKAASEYMNYDTALSDTLQNNWAVLGSILAPVLEKVISLFSTAVAYIANFIKILTGIDVVARANSKALDKQSASAKNALGNLAKFDDLNTVDFGDSNKNSLPTLTIDQVDTSPLDIFIAKIKEQDWYGLGMEISREFNEGLASINFDKFIEKASQFGTNFSDLLNGIFDGMDWKQLGTKVGQGLEGITEALYNFMYNTNWNVFGSGIGTSLVNSLNKVNFSKVGAVLVGKFNIAIKTLIGFVSTPGIWTTLGSKLADGFNSAWNSIDWNGLGKLFSDGIIGLLDTTITFIEKFDWASIGKAIGTFLSQIDWGTIFINLLQLLSDTVMALWDTAVGVGVGIAEGIFSGIDSLNDKIGPDIFKALAIALGVLTAALAAYRIQSNLAAIQTGITNGLLTLHTTITKIATAATTAFGAVMTFITSPITLVILGISSLIAIIVLLVKNWDKVTEVAGNVWNKVTEIWGNVKDWFSEHVTTPVRNTFTKVKDTIVNTFTDAKNKIIDTFRGVSSWFSEHVTNPIKNAFSGMWDGIKGILNRLIDGVNKVIGGVNKIKFDVPDWVPVIGGKRWGFDIKTIPKLATGTNKIEYEGLYHLHKDEAVVPKKYNPAVNNKAYEQGNSNVVNAIYTLIDVVQNMETTNIVNVDAEQVYKKTSKYANRKTNKYGVVVDDI